MKDSNFNFGYNKITSTFSFNNECKETFESSLLNNNSNMDVEFKDNGNPVFIRQNQRMKEWECIKSKIPEHIYEEVVIERMVNLDEVKMKLDIINKQITANEEKESISKSVELDRYRKILIDEEDGLIFNDCHICRKINSQNNIKKKRL